MNTCKINYVTITLLIYTQYGDKFLHFRLMLGYNYLIKQPSTTSFNIFYPLLCCFLWTSLLYKLIRPNQYTRQLFFIYCRILFYDFITPIATTFFSLNESYRFIQDKAMYFFNILHI